MVEADAGLSLRRIGAPAQVAEGDVAVGIMGGEDELERTIGLLTLDERVAHQHHLIGLAQFEDVGVSSGGRA